MQSGDVLVTYLDISSLERCIDLNPSTSLRDGLGNYAK